MRSPVRSPARTSMRSPR